MSIDEISELHITNIPRADKGRWVAASRAANSDLSTWAIAALNDAAKNTAVGLPPWARSLNNRTAWCLVNYGFSGKRQVRAAFSAPDFNWLSIPNFGRKNYDEVVLWIGK